MQHTAQAVRDEVAGSRLPPLPHVLVEMLKLCQDQTSSFQDMARVVSSDAVLASRLLTIANSSYYGRQNAAQSIERALLLLGTDQLKALVITASVQQMCGGLQGINPDYLKRFWSRSLRCALIVRALAHLTSYRFTEEAYLLGLLHRMGELVLATNHHDDYPGILYPDSGSQLENENFRYGTNSCELGRFLAEQWGLEPFAIDAITFQQAPLSEIADAHHATKILYLGVRLSSEGAPENRVPDVLVSEAAERLFNISGALACEIASRVSEEVTRMAAALGIELQNDDTEEFETVQNKLGQQLQRRMLNQEMGNLIYKPVPADSVDPDRAIDPRVIAQSVNVMFGYRNTLLFHHDEAEDTLVCDECDESASRIAISVQTSPSLMAQSATSQQVRWSHALPGGDSNLAVVDRQLLRLCNTPSMVYAPVVGEGGLLAMLVMGDPASTAPDDITCTLIEDFCRHMAEILAARLQREANLSLEKARMQEKVRAVVHEVGNPLTIVRNYLEALSASSPSEDDDRQYRILREEIDRAGQILMRLQDIEQDSSDERHGQSINGEISDLVRVFEHSICKSNGLGKSVECSLQLSEKLDNIRLPRNQLRQIITNLAKNAVEAMPNGGQIKFTTGLVLSSEKGKAVEIDIADTGPGLPEQIIANLFKPGYTTKDGNHSGLGLSITRNLVEEIGGTITCHSSERGTRFTIVIPQKK